MYVKNNKPSVRYFFYKVAGVPRSIKFGPYESMEVVDLTSADQITYNAHDFKLKSINTRFEAGHILSFTDGYRGNSLKLTWSSINSTTVSNPDVLSQWNTFFDLPANGRPFSQVIIDGNSVNLLGGSGITIGVGKFSYNNSLLKIIDNVNCINYLDASAFEGANLDEIYLPSLSGMASYSMANMINAVTSFYVPNLINLNLTSLEYSLFDCNVEFSSLITTNGALKNVNFQKELRLPSLTAITANEFEEAGWRHLYAPNVITVGDYAFYFSEITGVTLSKATTFGDAAFSSAFNLVSVEASLVSQIGSGCFGASHNIKEINLPSLRKITGPQAFYNCTSLSSVTANSLTAITSLSFYNCSNLKNVNLASAISADTEAFRLCTSLTEITLPVTTFINSQSFESCTSLQSVNFPLCTTIRNNSFKTCPSLQTIYIPSCTALGTTTANNSVFLGTTGKTITLTVPASRMTANGGNPDGDIQYLQANNTVTVVQT